MPAFHSNSQSNNIHSYSATTSSNSVNNFTFILEKLNKDKNIQFLDGRPRTYYSNYVDKHRLQRTYPNI